MFNIVNVNMLIDYVGFFQFSVPVCEDKPSYELKNHDVVYNAGEFK
jgi:hypothetical protein